MITRIFSDEISNQLACKAGPGEIPTAYLGDTSIESLRSNIVRLDTNGRTGYAVEYEALCGACEGRVEFVAVIGNHVYLVNTEGYEYPRYAGKLCAKDAALVIQTLGI